MNKIISNKKVFLVSILLLILAVSSGPAFAFGWARRLPPRHEVVVVRGERFHYHDGRFFRPGPFGFFVVTPPIGAFVTFIPEGRRTIIMGGMTYYYYDDIYYQPVPSGYVVVPEPVDTTNVVYVPEQKPQVVSAETIVINVPNSNGSYTPVALIKQKNGYTGPQGEYYPGHPTIDQLKALYGK